MHEEQLFRLAKPAWRGGERDAATGLTRWLAERGPLAVDVGPVDWRDYRLLRLAVRSEEATGACLRLEVLGCEEELLAEATFPVDWRGEQEVSFALQELGPRPADEERYHLTHALRFTLVQRAGVPTVLTLGAVEALR